ncbi:NAD(P)-dependent dehydrogenase, short-chain alcohol dehydrogenase family [Variovorax sp. HW608]|uniref:SDR family NAD(P)-dependent oxidoreductase n=1 Tax=Variovorax sp. HW608 TaxID=1034889 RepID=UPI00081FDE77|nr:SDR family NAD(P)-dependent oxidoreductase [Variovorax sp. HW608]SCK14149.1 NAD(P)-dependent dehydrogenase, short-chain alcohol dehydrogenase family [Variovorax sp. HW608]
MLHSRRILVTGGSSGIGAATARLALEQGAIVHVLDLHAPTFAHANLSWSLADLSDAAAVARAVESFTERSEPIDGLANVAGISEKTGALGASDSGLWRKVLDVNTMGALRVTEAALPALKRARDASIVNVSSAIGLRPYAGTGAYAASKSALVALTRVWAMELAPAIRVNAVCPGAIDTPLLNSSASRQDGVRPSFTGDNAALKRIGQPEEVANAILFLLGPQASYITGTALAVDGGRAFH